MARSITMGNLIQRCQWHADKENNAHISSEEWRFRVSMRFAQAHALVTDAGCRYFETEQSITATGASSYNLDAGYKATLSVEIVLDSAGRRRPLRGPIPPQRQAFFAGLTGQATDYALVGTTIILLPLPGSGTYKHKYIAQPSSLSDTADETEVDVVDVSFETYLYWGVACDVGDKAEDNIMFKNNQLKEAELRLRMWAVNQALTEGRQRVTEDEDLDYTPGDWVY